MQNKKKARVIAFYLPQFHPISENDEWWGRGFTEWTNVAKAKPLFKGHYQPRIPADLGFYDLRMPEIREAQAEMAQEAGVEGFCYWHYWFGNGKQLLERPFNEVLESGKPDFPFCLGWANHSWSNKSWTKTSKYSKERLLMEQTYPGEEDHNNHFYSLLKAFKDNRYIKVDGKPLFVIFEPLRIPDVKKFIKLWNSLAVLNGLKGIHFVGIVHTLSGYETDQNGKKIKFVSTKDKSAPNLNKVLDLGFDAINSRSLFRAEIFAKNIWVKYLNRAIIKYLGGVIVDKYKYSKIIEHLYIEEDSWENVYPSIIPSWDRSPRSGKLAKIWHGSTPEYFKKSVEYAIEKIKNKDDEHKIIFLKSWNEWAESNYIEPDLVFGKAYLNVLREAIVLDN